MTYAQVHRLLTKERGRAAERQCHDCGGPAQQWAYNHSGLNEVDGIHCACRVTYSTDIWQYVPMCIKDHVRRDRQVGWA